MTWTWGEIQHLPGAKSVRGTWSQDRRYSLGLWLRDDGSIEVQGKVPPGVDLPVALISPIHRLRSTKHQPRGAA